jgi:hypothetical protein
VASVIAELTIAIFYVRMSAGYITWRQLAAFSWRRLIAGIIMCTFVICSGKLLNSSGFAIIIIQVVIGVASYGGVLLILKDKMLNELIGMGLNIFERHRKKT